MSSREITNNRVNLQATKCCRPMTAQERQAFIRAYRQAYVRRRDKRGRVNGSLFDTSRTVYEVDGREFNKLWDLVRAYAERALVLNFRGKFRADLEDDLMEIRYKLFHTLRFLGPKPSGAPMSTTLVLVVASVISNLARRRFRLIVGRLPSKTDYSDMSERHITNVLEGHDMDTSLLDVVPLLASVPQNCREVTEQVLGGEFFTTACKRYGLRSYQYRAIMRTVLDYGSEV